MEGTGVLQPSVRRDVFVSVDGNNIVTNVLVEQGQMVEKDQTLVVLRNSDLDIAIEQLNEEFQTANESLRQTQRMVLHGGITKAERDQLGGRITQYREQVTSLRIQLALIKSKQEQLVIRSPIAGQIVTTWNVLEQLIQRPVTVGQVLITVVDPDSDWELEIYMPENTMGHVARAWNERPDKEKGLSVTYVLANEPENKHKGMAVEIGEAAEMHEQYEYSVPVRVQINDEDVADRRVGIEATAKLYCGTRSIGYTWFHELFEFVQTRVLF